MSLGRVAYVEEVRQGSELAADILLGALELTVEDPTDFSPDGGSLLIGIEELDYASADEETGLIVLDEPTTAAYTVEEAVYVVPETIERFAHVELDDQEETLQARIPHALYDRLDVGIRDDATGEQELVELERTPDGELIVTDVLDREPVVDGIFIDPTTIPPAPATDGNPPATSPTPSVQGGVRSLFATWVPVANADAVTYEVHVSTSSGFTPGPTTFAGEVSGTLFVIRTLPGTTDPPAYGTVYFVRLIAKDLDGAAAVGAESSGTPAEVTGTDIVVEGITADHLLANEALFEKVQALLVRANTLRTADEGARFEADVAGARLIAADESALVDLPTDPALSPTFTGDVITGGLLVLGNALIQGADNVMDKGAALVLGETQADPTTSPTLSRVAVFENLTGQPGGSAQDYNVFGMSHDPAGGPAGATPSFWIANGDVSTARGAREFAAASPFGFIRELNDYAAIDALDPFNVIPVHGVVRCGSWVFLLIEYGSNKFELRRYLQSDLSFVSKRQIQGDFVNLFNEAPTAHSLATDGTKIYVVHMNNSNSSASSVRVYEYGTDMLLDATYTLTGKTFDTRPTFGNQSVSGATFAEGSLWVFVHPQQVYAFDPTTHAYIANRDFKTNAFADLAHDGTRFWTGRNRGSSLYKHSLWDWTTESPKFWAGYTWRIEAADDETLVSPRTSIDLTNWRRAWIFVTRPDFPPGIDRARIFVARGATAPATTALKRQTMPTFISTETASPALMSDFDPLGAAPPTVNTFPGGGASEIRAIGGGWALRGDGSGYVPGLAIQELWSDPAAVNLTGTAAAVDSVTLTLPAGWGSMDVLVFAKCGANNGVSSDHRVLVQLESPAGTAIGQPATEGIIATGAYPQEPIEMSVMASLVGITASQTIRLMGEITGGTTVAGDATALRRHAIALKIRRS